MNKTLLYLLSLIILVFSYTIYQSVKLDGKLSNSSFNQTGTIINQYPEEAKFVTLESNSIFDIKKKALNAGVNVVIHFWASWCAPCEAEFSELTVLTESLKENKNVLFLFVAVNDELVKVKKFLKKYKISENVVLLADNNDQAKLFGTYKLPETFVFNSTGKIIKKFSGQQAWSQKYLLDFFKNL